MTASGAWVAAEWAVLGKEQSDAGYRLLSCSDGAISEQAFTQLLTRYSPGTLRQADLPQVTISWLKDVGKSRQRYIALAVYYQDEQRRGDVSGRDVMLTNCFCVPYDDLAAGAVSYLAMYEQFCRVPLPVSPPGPIRAVLTNPAGLSAAGWQRPATKVAGLLLTNTPVCVVGADRATVVERLSFIDAVASMLPYGMRSELSAATWTSSTFRTHKMRLFFASADRRASTPDHLVTWGVPDGAHVTDAYAKEYLAMQASGQVQVADLASDTKPARFSKQDVLRMLERLSTAKPPHGWSAVAIGPTHEPEPPTVSRPGWLPGEPPVAEELPPADEQVVADGSASSARPAAESASPSAHARQMAEIDEIFSSCAFALKHGDPKRLKAEVEQLRPHLDGKTREEHRPLGELIETRGLLRQPDVAIDIELLHEFYIVLLRLAFTTPLGYSNFCRVEQRAGYLPGERLHAPLVRAMLDVGLQGAARLLVLGSVPETELETVMRVHPVSPDESAAMLVEQPQLHPVHAKVACELAVWNLTSAANDSKQGRKLFKAAMDQRNLLAELQRRHADDPELQLYALSHVLSYAYDGALDRPDAVEILRKTTGAPTVGLLGAMIRLAAEKDRAFILRWYAVRAIDAERFAPETRDDFRRLCRADDYPPESGRHRQLRVRLPRLRHDSMLIPVGMVVAFALAFFLFVLLVAPG